MARNSYANAKGRGDGGTFFQLPHAVFRCPNYLAISNIARALLIDLCMQYNSKNNGDLVTTWRVMSSRGWTSKTTLKKHTDELIYYGFIVIVQEGGINVAGKKRPNLYALSWLSIDRIGFSDGYTGSTVWKVGDVPRTWSDVKTSYYPPRKKRKCPAINKKPKYISCTGVGTSNVLEMGKTRANK